VPETGGLAPCRFKLNWASYFPTVSGFKFKLMNIAGLAAMQPTNLLN